MKKTMENVKRNVNSYLSRDDNSRVLPGKNDKVKTKGIYKQKRVLSDSLAYLHLKYNTEATRKTSLATFCRMKPKHIALTRYISRNKCLYQKHQNMALKAMTNVGITVPLNPDEYERKLRGNEEIMQTCFVEMKDGEVALQQSRGRTS